MYFSSARSKLVRREPSLLPRRPSFISLQIETQFSITTFVSSREKSDRSMGTFFCRHHRTSLSSSAAELTPKSERITQKRRRRCFAVKDNSLHGDHNHANAPPSRAKGAICLSQITSSLNNNHRDKKKTLYRHPRIQ